MVLPGVDAVLLDVGGVLVMPSHRIVGGAALAHRGDPTAAAMFRGHYEGVAAAERPGGFVWDDYRRALLAAAGVPAGDLDAAAGALAEEMADPALVVWNEVLPGVPAGLGALAATGVALAVVSNSDGTVAALLADLALAQVGPGPGTPVRAIVDSGAVGVAKPDPAIFAVALEALDVDPAAVVHVGDTVYADVDGAAAAGIRPVHVDPIGWCGSDTHDHVADLAGVAALLTGAA